MVHKHSKVNIFAEKHFMRAVDLPMTAEKLTESPKSFAEFAGKHAV